MHSTQGFSAEISNRLGRLDATAAQGGFADAADILARTVRDGGVIHAFGTGHSEAFAMEIAGRAGGLIPTHAVRLSDLILLGTYDRSWMGTAEFERTPGVADALFDLYDIRPADCFVIASNSGANGSIVGFALRAQAEGHLVIAVTSLEHSRRVESKHPSKKRLFEVADIVIDNLAPYGDATISQDDGAQDDGAQDDGAQDDGPLVGPVSSITGAYIAQLLTLFTTAKLTEAGIVPPIFLSANIPGGDAHNTAIQAQYGQRINPFVAFVALDGVALGEVAGGSGPGAVVAGAVVAGAVVAGAVVPDASGSVAPAESV